MITKKHASTSKQEVEKFVVRLPKGMRDRIADVSRASRRSMNSEIVARLEDSLGESWNESAAAQPTGPILRAVENPAQMPAGDQESLLLEAFRRMDDEKRAALLALVR